MIGEERPIGIKMTNPGNVDWYYGGGLTAYPTIEDALATIPVPLRLGKTVGILEDGKVVEYWFASGTGDNDLIVKTTEVDLTDYYTKEQTDSTFQVKGAYLTGVTTNDVAGALGYTPISAVTVDLSGYYTKPQADNRYQLQGNYITNNVAGNFNASAITTNGSGSNYYGSFYLNKDVSQGAIANRYLILTKVTGGSSIVGNFVGKRVYASGVGTYSANLYVNIRQSSTTSTAYWECDGGANTVQPVLVTVTYDDGTGADTWYALDAVGASASSAFEKAIFTGQADTGVLFTWVPPASVTALGTFISNGYKNFGGRFGVNVAGTFTINGLTTAGAVQTSAAGALTSIANTGSGANVLAVSPIFTGSPSAPTATAGTNTTQIATTAFVTAANNLKANIASPSFTGLATVTNTTEQLRLSYDASNYVPFTVSSTGTLSLMPTGAQINIGASILFGSDFRNQVSTNNARFQLSNAGGIFTRNVADANPALTISQANASSTGNILTLNNNGGTVASISQGGTISGVQLKVNNLNTAPASSTDTGVTGEIRVTAGFIYVCTATNTWVRTALTTF